MAYVADFKLPILRSGYGGALIEYTVDKYPAGEMHVRLLHPEQFKNVRRVYITANLTSGDAIMTFFSLIGAIREISRNVDLTVILPYLPYSRQDRACHPGEDFALKTFLSLLCGFLGDKPWCVVTQDVHSDVAAELFKFLGYEDRLEVIAAETILADAEWVKNYDYIVAPDAGAVKRATGVSLLIDRADPPPVITMTKDRDPDTGYLSKFGVATDLMGFLPESNLLLVDDICDGGRTFVGAAKALRDVGFTGKISLYVTHGIFSAGYAALAEAFDAVYVENNISVCTDTRPENIRIL